MSTVKRRSEKEIPDVDAGLVRIRHSLAHIMAQAVLTLYPNAKLAIGPPIADGFYYDFDLGADEHGQPVTFSPEDLERIEGLMRQTLASDVPFVAREVGADQARALFPDQPYKLELIDGLVQGTLDEHGEPVEAPEAIQTYQHDGFVDLCRGPHVARTGDIPEGGFKLLSVAGAYWRGDEQRPMLQRIYGTAWHDQEQLAAHLQRLEEAKERDHRNLGRELELFIFDEEVGPGLALWLPRGEIIVEEVEKLAWEVEAKAGYQRVRTPHIAKEALYLRSGHLPYYEEDMYPPMDREGAHYYLRPMNCPFHHKIYASKTRSYRDLPLRLAEYGMIYRYEKSGELFGLMRVRGTQQNDAHIYCSEAEVEGEFAAVLELYRFYFELLGIDQYRMRLSKHGKSGLGKKYIDDLPSWHKAEDLARRAMADSGIPFYEAEDEAAFYGPKIDVQICSATGREFSVATNQVDFAQPRSFELSFTNQVGFQEMPWCIHRAPLGSHERLIGFLIEHFAGAFPLWLSPEQVRVIPITDAHHDYARRVTALLEAGGIRAQADLSASRMGAKIRQAQQLKVPYMLVIGNQEMAEETVSVRVRDGRRLAPMATGAFAAMVEERIASRAKDL